jgi:hypothetical protein
LQAEDADSGKYGQLSYRIVTNNSFFKIDQMSGIITTTNTFSSVDPNQLPFIFYVEVMDNPNSSYNSFIANASVVVSDKAWLSPCNY